MRFPESGANPTNQTQRLLARKRWKPVQGGRHAPVCRVSSVDMAQSAGNGVQENMLGERVALH